jgi:hypothetical protein
MFNKVHDDRGDDQSQEDTINLSAVSDADGERSENIDAQGADTIHMDTAESETRTDDDSIDATATQEQTTDQDSATASSPEAVPLYTRVTAAADGERDAYGNRILRKQGASTPTIVLGSLLIVSGALSLMLGWFGTQRIWDSVNLDWRLAVAVMLAAIGAVLLLSSLLWAISALIRTILR